MQAIIKTHGTVSFVNGYRAVVDTPFGQVHVPTRFLTEEIVWRARVALEVTKSVDKKDKRRAQFQAEKILPPILPPMPASPPVELYGIVQWFDNAKRMGYVTLLGEHAFGDQDAKLPGKVIPRLKPNKGDRVRVMVEETMTGPRVTNLEFGDRITAVVDKLMAQSKPVEASDTRIYADTEGGLRTVDTAKSQLGALLETSAVASPEGLDD